MAGLSEALQKRSQRPIRPRRNRTACLPPEVPELGTTVSPRNQCRHLLELQMRQSDQVGHIPVTCGAGQAFKQASVTPRPQHSSLWRQQRPKCPNTSTVRSDRQLNSQGSLSLVNTCVGPPREGGRSEGFCSVTSG